MRTLIATAAIFLLVTTAFAASPDVKTIVSKMKTALEPPRPSSRKLEFIISAHYGGGTEQTTWTAGQLRKAVSGRNQMITVLLAPAELRGENFLAQEGAKGSPAVNYAYLSTVRRVRKISPLGDYEQFLDSDYSYADLGFVTLNSKYSLAGTETRGGKQTYKIQAVPSNRYFYSKIITWVDVQTMLPVERNYYDGGGALWKAEYFEEVAVIDGTPTVLKMRMEDKQTQTSTRINVSSVRYDIDLPDSAFAPDSLPKALDLPVWDGMK